VTSPVPPGQPYQQPHHQQPQQQQQQPYGYPEPNGNHLGLQNTPQLGQLPQQVALGHLRIYLQGSFMTSSMITPTLMLNNQPVRASYGPNDYHVPAGQYHVSASAQWMRQYGQAALDVMVPPNHTVEVYYAAPMHQFTTGSMGFTKQRRKGAILMVGLIVFLVLLILVPLILSLVMS
jgi:hypothetical protein